jgi:hypothetical protein
MAEEIIGVMVGCMGACACARDHTEYHGKAALDILPSAAGNPTMIGIKSGHNAISAVLAYPLGRS